MMDKQQSPPATLADVDTAFYGQAAVIARLLNAVTGIAIAVGELREQIDGLVVDSAGTPDASISALPASEHMSKIHQELSTLRSMFHPTRQERRAFERSLDA